jgi:adenylate kinase family enzyme
MQGNPVVAFSGGIGAGKTTVSSALASRLACPRASFGDYVRAVASSRGLGGERQVLQAVGEELVRDIPGFVRAVLAQAGWERGQSLVVDGVRHLEVLAALRRVALPQETTLFFLDVPETERRARVADRDGIGGIRDVEDVDVHSTEVQVKDLLRDAAQLVLPAGISVPAILSTILCYLGLKD